MLQSSFLRNSAPRIRADSEFFHSRKDEEFDQVFPTAVSRQSIRHWSPVHVCRKAAQLLVVDAGTRVLDIGSGPGKFCIIGATSTPGHFTGVEQRAKLACLAQEVVRKQEVPRVRIVHGKIQDVNFCDFDAFYLFNPFQENILPSLRIDDDAEATPQIYTDCITHVWQQLMRMPLGTRVVTYCGDCAEIPASYDCVKTAFNDTLKLWVKKHPPTDAPPPFFLPRDEPIPQPAHADHRPRD